MGNISKGAAGEVLAARFLRDKGYEITHANYRCRFGEIDIIARDGPYIVFVEVKTRRADALYAPEEAVTRAKQLRLIKRAGYFLLDETEEGQPRFDVIEVVLRPDDPLTAAEIRHLENAFGMDDLHGAF